MPLASLDAAGFLHLHRDALDALDAAPRPLCVIGLAGPAGEGKTTMANALATSVARGAPPPAGVGLGGGAHDGEPPFPPLPVAPFNASRAPSGGGGGGGGGGVWMWIHAGGEAAGGDGDGGVGGGLGGGACGSVAVLDSAAVTGGGLAPAWHYLEDGTASLAPQRSELAQHRLLSLLMLGTSRLALSVRRQPKTDLLHRLLSAAVTTIELRLPPPAAEGGLLPHPPPSAAAPEGAAAAGGGGGGPTAHAELVMLLRDSSGGGVGSAAAPGSSLPDGQALRRWLPGPAAEALEAATAAWSVMALPPPTADDLDAVERTGWADGGGAAAAGGGAAGGAEAGGFAASLGRGAAQLTTGLRAVAPGGGHATYAAWLEHVAARLNALDASTAPGMMQPGEGRGGV